MKSFGLLGSGVESANHVLSSITQAAGHPPVNKGSYLSNGSCGYVNGRTVCDDIPATSSAYCSKDGGGIFLSPPLSIVVPVCAGNTHSSLRRSMRLREGINDSGARHLDVES